MITHLQIKGFKRFSNCQLPFAPLTILTGLNGAGKTSVIQAILLAREATLPNAKSIALNGPYGLELGRAEDILNFSTAQENPEVEFGIGFRNQSTILVRLRSPDLQLQYLQIQPTESEPVPFWESNRAFSYLCAERLGPRDVLGMSAQPSDQLNVGVKGEFCAQILASRGLRERVFENRRHPSSKTNALLKYQTERWLSDIVRPTDIETLEVPGTSVTALRFRTPGGEWVRAPNMGFGVSYALPIILAGLHSSEQSFLLIENPEAHLHPAGQSRMGHYLAMLATAGVQVVVETHSDHVLNGVRRAIGEHKLLSATDALVHFFDSNDVGNPLFSTLRFTTSGNLDSWPKSFFDQYQSDVAALAKVRRLPGR